MSASLPVSILRVRAVEARIVPFEWTFQKERAGDIAANWARRVANSPTMFNGTVLLQHHSEMRGETHIASYAPVDYASFLGWRDLGWPGPPVKNGFAMAALRAADGAFLLGRMGAHTANAGKTYFAAGTPDLHDVLPDGTVDLGGSLVRELMEETGLQSEEIAVADPWTLAIEPFRTAYLRETRVPWPTDEALAIMNGRLATETDGELSEIIAVRSADEINAATTPDFAVAYMRWAFLAESSR
jgi:8-oxo-dGTP pyrophosphatase MutT (NUDIX family)